MVGSLARGYRIWFQSKRSGILVWSAPNYCYRCGNIASVMEFDEHLNRGFKKFDCAPTEDRNKPERKPVSDYFL